jgi:hypothetical protein
MLPTATRPAGRSLTRHHRWRKLLLAPLLLLVAPLALLAWQHSQLEAARLHTVLTAAPLMAAAPELLPPTPGPAPTSLSQPTAHRLHFSDGEVLGQQSAAHLCIVMPVRSSNLRRALRNVRSWSTQHSMPCNSTRAPPAADLCFFHSQSFQTSRDQDLAEQIVRALSEPSGPAETFESTHTMAPSFPMNSPGSCFGAVRFLAARIPLDVDVYTIFPTHNFTGPNTHFLSTFGALRAVARAGLATYSSYQQMETDAYPFRPGWIDALCAVAARRRKEWVMGSRSHCLRSTEVEHINGNALYAIDHGFERELRRELNKRMDTWAFDVLIGHWLFRKHPARIRESPHILSISTFQRNRTCCEMVRQIADGGGGTGAAGRTWPHLLLLHTGNIAKLRDSMVPPSMRALGLMMQDLFVPRSDEPCTFDSTLPNELRSCHSSTQPWRIALKAQSAQDCRATTSTPRALFWVPGNTESTQKEEDSMLSVLNRSYHIRFRRVGADATHADTSVEETRDGGFKPVEVLIASQVPSLLAALRENEVGQLVALLRPPTASLWRAYQTARAAAGAGAPDLDGWIDRVEPNMLVSALSSCSGASTEEHRSLEYAKTVLQERVLTILLTENATRRGVALLGRFFGWTSRDYGNEDDGNDKLYEADRPLVVNDGAPPPDAAVLLKQKVALDVRLYEFASRLADEQYRSVVWDESSQEDVCAAAEAVGEAASAKRVPLIALPFDTSATFTWDGESYRVYEVQLRAPMRAMQLLLRGKNVIGSSPFTVNVFISHRSPQPSFAERTFRYVFESHPPHKRAGKFVLPASSLLTACSEAAKLDGDSDGLESCRTKRSLTLWIGFKCRSVAVVQLTVLATARTGLHH